MQEHFTQLELLNFCHTEKKKKKKNCNPKLSPRIGILQDYYFFWGGGGGGWGRGWGVLCSGSMTYAPTTNAPARNANVEAYINPDPNPNPNPYPALNQKPNHTHESNSVFGEVSMPEQLSPEHMSCHLCFPGYYLNINHQSSNYDLKLKQLFTNKTTIHILFLRLIWQLVGGVIKMLEGSEKNQGWRHK